MEYLIITGRVISILAIALFITLITGRRKIGELPIFDFIVIITLGAIIGADIADPKIPHFPTAYAVILLVVIQYIYSLLIIRNRRIGKTLTFEPIIVIENGQFVKGNLKKINYGLDNILMMLREKGVFDLKEVEFAIIEANGNLSVLKKADYQPVTPKELKLKTNYKGLTIPLIVEGEVYDNNLDQLNLDRKWLLAKLKGQRIDSFEDVFYATIDSKGTMYISKGLDKIKDIHHLRH